MTANRRLGSHQVRALFVAAACLLAALPAGACCPALPAGAAPASGWLTAFEDQRWPRAVGDDLYFDAASDPSTVRPPPIVRTRETLIPIELVVVVVAPVLLLLWRRRASPPSP